MTLLQHNSAPRSAHRGHPPAAVCSQGQVPRAASCRGCADAQEAVRTKVLSAAKLSPAGTPRSAPAPLPQVPATVQSAARSGRGGGAIAIRPSEERGEESRLHEQSQSRAAQTLATAGAAV